MRCQRGTVGTLPDNKPPRNDRSRGARITAECRRALQRGREFVVNPIVPLPCGAYTSLGQPKRKRSSADTLFDGRGTRRLTSLMERPYLWFGAATALNVAWALLFWLVFFVGISWHLLRVPMGLGGAVYPTLFFVPVLVGATAYQCVILLLRKGRSFNKSEILLWSLWVPCAMIAVCLVAFCPMDTDQSYLGYIWSRAW